MQGGFSGRGHGGLEPSAPSEQQMRETRLPGVAVPSLFVWIKEQHDLGGVDLIRGTRPNTQAWNVFAQLLTKIWAVVQSWTTCHPSVQPGFIGCQAWPGPARHGTPPHAGVFSPPPPDPAAALSAPRNTSGGANTRSLPPSTRPPCCRTLTTQSSLRSASGTTGTSSTRPACHWPPPPSTAGRSLMVRPETTRLAGTQTTAQGAEP